jgi:Flp pilus assembly protein TadB
VTRLTLRLSRAQVNRMRGTLRPVSNVTPAQFLVAFLLAAGAGTAVFFHAERHKVPHPSAWASFVFLFLIAGLPSYLLRVRRLRKQRGRV